jgi:hypothetical protein
VVVRRGALRYRNLRKQQLFDQTNDGTFIECLKRGFGIAVDAIPLNCQHRDLILFETRSRTGYGRRADCVKMRLSGFRFKLRNQH